MGSGSAGLESLRLEQQQFGLGHPSFDQSSSDAMNPEVHFPGAWVDDWRSPRPPYHSGSSGHSFECRGARKLQRSANFGEIRYQDHRCANKDTFSRQVGFLK